METVRARPDAAQRSSWPVGLVAVGLVAATVARHFGTVAGHVAGATLAVTALVIRQFEVGATRVEAAGPVVEPLLGPACRRLALVLPLPAKHPGAIFADRPLARVAELLEETPDPQAVRWAPTSTAPLCAVA